MNLHPLLQKSLPHIGAILLFLVLNAFYFSPQLSGKKVRQSDVIQYLGMAQEVKQFKKETGETSLWTNSMFGGMPTYQINTSKVGNNLKYLERVSYLGFKHPIGVFFAAMLGFYILLVVLGVNPWLSIVGAIAFGFSTNNFILFEAGHETKLRTIAFLPMVAAGMLLAYRNQLIWGGILFALGLGMNIMSNHPQMTYYYAMTLLFFAVARFVYDWKNNNLPHFFKASAVLVLAAFIALGSAASNLWTTYEYSKDTMRGDPILTSDAPDPSSSSATEGLAWDYAMQWSNGTIDVFASFIPGIAGGGSGQVVDESSAFVKALKRISPQVPNEIPAPLYWGNLPFTSGPIYLGTITFFLFFLGLWLVKGPIKWWIGLGTLLTIVLSMGYNMEGINRFFFDYFPLFNKWRTPNSVLSVTAFLLPILGFLAVHQIFTGKVNKADALKGLYIATGVAAGLCLFFMLLGPSFFDLYRPTDGDQISRMLGGQLQESMRQDLSAALAETRAEWMRGDAFRSLVLVLLSAALLWAFLTDRIQQTIVIAGLGILTLFDLFTVGKRYLSNDDFISASNYNNSFTPRPADDEILKDQDPNFRVLDLTVSTFQSSFSSYFHKSLGGYHAAKLQRYQDIIDRHLSQGNRKVISMLNTKYFITQGQGGNAVAQRNQEALGNAWFIDTLQMVNSPNEEIDGLTDFNPNSTAVVHNEFAEYLSGLQLNKGGAIQLTSYKPNYLSYESNAPAEQLAVFSEVWYGPDKGWQAYIDGNPVEHIRANYLLRALRVPAGQHKIEFKFNPTSFKRGVLVSQIFSTLILLGLLGFGGFSLYKQSQEIPEVKESPKIKATTPKKKASSKASSKRKKGKK